MTDDDPFEEWEIVVEHKRTGLAGMHTLTVDRALPPAIMLDDIRNGAAMAAANIIRNPWYRLPDEDDD